MTITEALKRIQEDRLKAIMEVLKGHGLKAVLDYQIQDETVYTVKPIKKPEAANEP